MLCAPVSAPWLKISEALDFVRLVGAPRNLGIHDRVYTEFAHGIAESHLARFLGDSGQHYVRVADGSDCRLQL